MPSNILNHQLNLTILLLVYLQKPFPMLRKYCTLLKVGEFSTDLAIRLTFPMIHIALHDLAYRCILYTNSKWGDYSCTQKGKILKAAIISEPACMQYNGCKQNRVNRYVLRASSLMQV